MWVSCEAYNLFLGPLWSDGKATRFWALTSGVWSSRIESQTWRVAWIHSKGPRYSSLLWTLPCMTGFEIARFCADSWCVLHLVQWMKKINIPGRPETFQNFDGNRKSFLRGCSDPVDFVFTKQTQLLSVMSENAGLIKNLVQQRDINEACKLTDGPKYRLIWQGICKCTVFNEPVRP